MITSASQIRHVAGADADNTAGDRSYFSPQAPLEHLDTTLRYE